jgi:hypothetical protein
MEGRREDLVGLGNPSNEVEMEIFYASTTITLDNGENAPFWEAPWFHDAKPKDIALLIYKISTRRK